MTTFVALGGAARPAALASPVINPQLASPAPRPMAAAAASVAAAPVQSALLGVAALKLASGALAGRRRRHRGRAAGSGRKVRVLCRDGAAASGATVDCVGIVGSSGAVGQEMLKCLEGRNFPTKKVRLFAKRAAGTVVKSAFGDITVEPFSLEAARECEVVLMAVSGDFSKEFSPQISGGPKNTCVIDNSSAWRMDPDVPLVVPEINGGKNSEAPLVANPNCTTAIGAMALWPLHQKYGLKKVIMSTYQAASGAGAEGMAELESGLAAYAKEGAVPEPEFFAHQLPFNVIPHIDAFQENGYTKEEMKVTWELQKIFGLPDSVKVSCTAVRVPTLRAHSESITIETEKPIDPAGARELLSSSLGVKVVDTPEDLKYPMPLNATGEYDVEVGRIRQSLIFGDHGLEFFVSGDQLLRGAALNAVLIAEQSVAARVAA
mmetsp:Transcript_39453/g.82661  ORF Transcript_39453/g.82661 Transcript_39453/m.82661 type:complete len:434 (+) Transcript_39453:83-1384(+)